MQLPRRRMVWFSAAVIVPCGALLYLGLRLVSQEEEIARQRERERRESRLEQARRSLQAAIEPLRLSPAVPVDAAFHGIVRSGKVELSWEQPNLPTRARESLAALRRAVDSGRAGSSDEKATQFEVLARLPADITDEYAVPLALYAVPRLSPERRLNAFLELEDSIAAHRHVISPTGLRLAISVARELGRQASRLEQMHTEARAAEGFQSAYPAAGGASSGRWMTYGAEPYLIGFTAGPVPGEFTFRAVIASRLAGGMKLVPGKGIALGEPFPGLGVELPADKGNGTPRQRPFVLATMALALAMALFGGVLLWRDFRRETQLAILRTQFVAGVSHELRTPLTAIRMFTEALHDNPDLDGPTRQEYLSTMLAENERLSRLVENVLEFSRMERSARKYELRRVGLQDLIQRIVLAHRPLLDHGGFVLETAIQDRLPDVLADPDALGQAVSNLLGNAMKYSGAAREIRLEAARVNEYAAIRVTDRGIGIPKHEQSRVFESFYRAHVPENGSIQGAGLGLTLVRHVMEAHGGRVTVESEPGNGSTFTLLLPTAREEQVK